MTPEATDRCIHGTKLGQPCPTCASDSPDAGMPRMVDAAVTPFDSWWDAAFANKMNLSTPFQIAKESWNAAVAAERKRIAAKLRADFDYHDLAGRIETGEY